MSEIQPDYKGVLFEVLSHLAHMEDDGADRRAMEWLFAIKGAATRHGEQALLLATDDAIMHLSHHQAKRGWERIGSGEP